MDVEAIHEDPLHPCLALLDEPSPTSIHFTLALYIKQTYLHISTEKLKLFKHIHHPLRP